MKIHEELYSKYITLGQSTFNGGLRRDFYFESVIRRLKINENASILDIGCGTGSLAYNLKSLGFYNYLGVDISEEQIGIAKTMVCDFEFQRIGIFDFFESYVGPKFDVIFLMDFLEHFSLEEIFKILEFVSRNLKVDGKVAIHVPNGGAIFSGIVRYGDLTHKFAFTKQSISVLMRKYNLDFKVYEDKPIVHNFFSLIRYLFWIVSSFIFRLIFFAETGRSNAVLSQNMLVLARKIIL